MTSLLIKERKTKREFVPFHVRRGNDKRDSGTVLQMQDRFSIYSGTRERAWFRNPDDGGKKQTLLKLL
jgi:hypothetical protein